MATEATSKQAKPSGSEVVREHIEAAIAGPPELLAARGEIATLKKQLASSEAAYSSFLAGVDEALRISYVTAAEGEMRMASLLVERVRGQRDELERVRARADGLADLLIEARRPKIITFY